MELLIVWAVVLLLVIALVGARAVVVEYPWIAQVVKRLFVRVHPAQRPRSFRRVAPIRYVKRGRVTIKQRSCSIHAQSRITGSPDHCSTPSRITEQSDITKQVPYKPLTPDQVSFVEECFTLNVILPKDKQFSCRNLYPVFSGTRDKRMKELSTIKERIEKQQQADRLAAVPIGRANRSGAALTTNSVQTSTN